MPKPTTRTTIIALATTALAAGSAAGQSSFTVRGTVYDFLYSHPDFGISSGDGLAYTAGLVDLELDSSGLPTLSGVGGAVAQPAYDVDGNLIALNVARDWEDLAGQAFILEGSPVYRNGPTIDGYDPEQGGYGNGNVHAAPDPTYIETLPPIPMPSISPKSPDFSLTSQALYNLSGDLYVDNFTLEQQTNIKIHGDVTIRVDNDFSIKNNCTIELAADATLNVFVGGSITFDNFVDINMNTEDHTRVKIWYTGTSDIDIGNNCRLYASIVAPDATLYMHNGADLYGTVATQGVRTRNGGVGLHLAGPGWGAPKICFWPDDKKGALGATSSGGITSAATFATWFQEVPGMNAAKFYRYAFLQQPDGSYLMEKPAFDPVNGELYGNEGDSNNGNFTSVIDAQFIYEACGSHFIEVTTDGELWAYLNGQLVLDISGNVSGGTQRYDFDRMALEDGKMYDMTIFFASRTGKAPYFAIRCSDSMFSTYDVAMPATYLGD